MIRVKYICETDGYKLYVSSSGQFLKTFISQSFDPLDDEVGSYCYGIYVYSGSEGKFTAD